MNSLKILNEVFNFIYANPRNPSKEVEHFQNKILDEINKIISRELKNESKELKTTSDKD